MAFSTDQKLCNLAHGDLIAMDIPLPFEDGRRRQFFKLEITHPDYSVTLRKALVCLETGARCQIDLKTHSWTKIDRAKLEWTAMHFTPCDESNYIWTVQDEDGKSHPRRFATRTEAQQKLANFLEDNQAKIDAGNRFHGRPYFKVVPMYGENTFLYTVI